MVKIQKFTQIFKYFQMFFLQTICREESLDILFPLAECVIPKVTYRESFSGSDCTTDHYASENPFVINYCLKVTKKPQRSDLLWTYTLCSSVVVIVNNTVVFIFTNHFNMVVYSKLYFLAFYYFNFTNKTNKLFLLS